MRKNSPRWETQVFTEIVPVLVLPDVIGASPGAGLIKQWNPQGHDEGTVGAGDSNGEYIHVDLDTEKRLDHKVIDPEQHHALDIVGVPFLSCMPTRRAASARRRIRRRPFGGSQIYIS